MTLSEDLGYFTLAADKIPKVFEMQQKKTRFWLRANNIEGF